MPPSITFTTVSSQRASTPLSAQSNQRRGTHVRSGLRYSHVRTERTSEEQEIRTSEALRHSSCWLLLWGWWTDGTITLRRCVVRSPVNFFFLSFAASQRSLLRATFGSLSFLCRSLARAWSLVFLFLREWVRCCGS